MARHINTNNKKFLVNLQALIRKSYTNSSGVVTNDIAPEPELEFIEPNGIDPIEPIIPEKTSTSKKRFISDNMFASKRHINQMDEFEAEYQAFIAKLKANKENKNTNETNIEENKTVIDTDLKTEETMEK